MPCHSASGAYSAKKRAYQNTHKKKKTISKKKRQQYARNAKKRERTKAAVRNFYNL